MAKGKAQRGDKKAAIAQHNANVVRVNPNYRRAFPYLTLLKFGKPKGVTKMNKADHDITGKYIAYRADRRRMYLVDYKGRFHCMGKGDFARAERYARILNLPIKVS